MENVCDTIHNAISELTAMQAVQCGALHERVGSTFNYLDCPIRLNGNTACCHPYEVHSAANIIARHIHTVLSLEQLFGIKLIDEKQLNKMLHDARASLSILDGTLYQLYAKNKSPADVVHHSANTQMTQAARINVVRQELIDALEQLLQEC